MVCNAFCNEHRLVYRGNLRFNYHCTPPDYRPCILKALYLVVAITAITMNKLLPKTLLCFVFLFFSYTAAYTQIQWIDSVKKALQKEKEDTNKINTLIQLASYYEAAGADTGVIYAQLALDLAKKLNFESGIF